MPTYNDLLIVHKLQIVKTIRFLTSRFHFWSPVLLLWRSCLLPSIMKPAMRLLPIPITTSTIKVAVTAGEGQWMTPKTSPMLPTPSLIKLWISKGVLQGQHLGPCPFTLKEIVNIEISNVYNYLFLAIKNIYKLFISMKSLCEGLKIPNEIVFLCLFVFHKSVLNLYDQKGCTILVYISHHTVSVSVYSFYYFIQCLYWSLLLYIMYLLLWF